MDGLSGTVGVASSVSDDNVFGIKFIREQRNQDDDGDGDDCTQEISDVSDLRQEEAIMENEEESPPTEDESMSDLERDPGSNPGAGGGCPHHPQGERIMRTRGKTRG